MRVSDFKLLLVNNAIKAWPKQGCDASANTACCNNPCCSMPRSGLRIAGLCHGPFRSKPRPYATKAKAHCRYGQRLRLQLGNNTWTLACVSSEPATGCRMELLPIMAQVVAGTEPSVPALSLGRRAATAPAREHLWDRTEPAAHCYVRIIQYLGLAMLTEGCISTNFKSGFEQFLHPHTAPSAQLGADRYCHMPAKTRFAPGSALHKDEGPVTWYTWVVLGRDSAGKMVKCRAHQLIAAAKCGVPDSLFPKNSRGRPSMLPKSQQHQALHHPSCPGCKGGCNNPLHIRWGTPEENRKDREQKRQAKNEGPKAHGKGIKRNDQPDWMVVHEKHLAHLASQPSRPHVVMRLPNGRSSSRLRRRKPG